MPFAPQRTPAATVGEFANPETGFEPGIAVTAM